VLLLRDIVRGIEVLMVRRLPRGFFGGLLVFPGGAVDPEDESDLAAEVVLGDGPDRSYRVAALRELAEETGLALTDKGMAPAPAGRGRALYEAMKEAGLRLDGSALTLVSRWVTPEFAPKRFDTLFFMARVGDTPEIRLDTSELVDHMWVRPSIALSRHSGGELEMFLPTIAHLKWLDGHSNVDSALASAAGADGRSLVDPDQMDEGSIVSAQMPVDLR
jgi:8-oxo-dGTP pyrophosphatase MutT (NUDIX family)